MKTLNRPMFRYGGPIKEGVMNGIREPKQNGGTIAGGNQMGMPMGNRTGFADPVNPGYLSKLGTSLMNFYNPLKKGKVISKLGSKITKIPKYKYVDGGNMIKETPMLQRAIQFGKANPKLTGAGAAAGMTSGVIPDTVGAIGTGIKNTGLQIADLLVSDKYFDQDKYFADKKKAKLEKENTTTLNTDIKKLLEQPTKPKKSEKELRAEQIAKYRDIVDIKGMNKDAAYNSLIAASQAISGEGDFKGSLKDGSLINKIIQSTSKAFDKPTKTKDAIDTLILKAEIEKDLNKDKNRLDTEYKKSMIDINKKKLEGSNFAENKAVIKKAGGSGQSGIDDAAALNNDNFRGNIVVKTDLDKVIKGQKEKGILDQKEIVVSYTNTLIEGKELPDGDYTVGDYLVTIQNGKVYDLAR